jgi:hypothetical protein
LLASDVASAFFDAVVTQARAVGLLSPATRTTTCGAASADYGITA